MTFQDKLRHHLAEKDVTWTFDGSRAVASWNEAGPRLLVGVPGTLAAASVLDAYVEAQAQQARVTVVHEGPATPVALRAATRFGVTLLDATHWPVPAPSIVEPEPAAEAPIDSAPVAPLPEVVPDVAAPALAETLPEMPFVLEAVADAPSFAEPALLLAAHEALLLLPAHVEEAADLLAPVAEPAAVEGELAIEALAAVLPVEAPAFEAEPLAVAEEVLPVEAEAEVELAEAVFEPVVAEPQPESEPAPVVDYIEAPSYAAPELAHASLDAEMPWAVAATQPEPVAVLSIAHEELAALPWHVPAAAEGEEDHVELLPGNPRQRRFVDHPTAAASGWGLPWPRPVAPADGLAIADPRIWKTADRLHAVREDLDKVGAPSFGAAPSEGSQWLKRISQFGAP